MEGSALFFLDLDRFFLSRIFANTYIDNLLCIFE